MVCNGAICMCNFGASPDKLVVKSHNKEYINDRPGSKKLIASTKELGATFEKNTFGPCQKQPIGSGFKPCQAVVTAWSNYYEEVTLANKGNILLEDSKAACPIGGKDCIKIIFHGQVLAPTKDVVKKTTAQVITLLNPLLYAGDLTDDNAENYW
jgi:hypothetical protein